MRLKNCWTAVSGSELPWVSILCPLVLFLAWGKFLLPSDGLYAVDYLSRIGVIWIFLAFGGRALPGPTEPWPFGRVAVVVIVGGAALFALDPIRDLFALPSRLIFNPLFPYIEDDLLRLFDLTVGLALVAVSEEIAFRRVLYGLWSGPWPQAVVFGLLHAPQGLTSVIAATAAGWVLMRIYTATGCLAVPVVLHYAINLQAFTP